MRSPLTDSTTLANPISGHFRGSPSPIPGENQKPRRHQQQNQIINTPPEAHQPPAAIPFSRGTPTTLAAPFSASHRGVIPRPGHRNRPPQQPLTPATLEHHGKIEFVKTNPENPTTRWYFREPPPGPKLISSFRPAPRWHKTIYTPTEHRRTPPPQNNKTPGQRE